jgi:drug/metabolite transporter (DMT)-like permease
MTVALAPAQPVVFRPFMAALWMTGALVSFSLMAVAGREAQAEVSTFELMTWRSLMGLVILSAIIARMPQGFAVVRTNHPWLHVQRNFFHFFGQTTWFLALMLIPLAPLTALEFTGPVWVILLAPLLLGERMTGRKILALLLGFLGVLIVARPGVEEVGIGHALALACALGFALSTIWTKKIMTVGDRVICMLFWMTVSQTVIGFVLAMPGGFVLPSLVTWGWLFIVGVTGLTAHYSISTALTLAPASLVSPTDLLRLPVLAVVGAMIYGEELVIWVFVGGALIVGANILNLTAKRS